MWSDFFKCFSNPLWPDYMGLVNLMDKFIKKLKTKFTK